VDGLAVAHAEVGLAAVELLLLHGRDALGALALAGLLDGEAVVVVDADVDVSLSLPSCTTMFTVALFLKLPFAVTAALISR
jgi:hypothetical protein